MRMTLCGTAQVVFLKYVDLEWNLNFFTTLHTNVHLRVGLSIDLIDCVWCDLFVCLLCVFLF